MIKFLSVNRRESGDPDSGNAALSPSGPHSAPHPSPLVRIYPTWRPHELFDLCCGGNGPPRSDPRPERSLQRGYPQHQGQPRRRRLYFDDNGKIPLLGAVKAAEEGPPRSRTAARLPADRRRPRLQSTRCRTCCSARTAPSSPRPRLTAQALGGTGALKHRRRLSQAPEPLATVYISDPSWENHRALFESAGFRSTPTLLRPGNPRRELRGMKPSFKACPPARWSCCTPAATTPLAPTCPKPSGPKWSKACAGAWPDPLPRHGLPGLCRRHRGRRRGGAPFSASGLSVLRVQLLLQELLALWRARRRPVRRHRRARTNPAA
jgi:hypothetical protein